MTKSLYFALKIRGGWYGEWHMRSLPTLLPSPKKKLERAHRVETFIVPTQKEDHFLRLLLNLLFYHLNRSEPTYKSHHIKLLDVIAACNQLNVNTLKKILLTIKGPRGGGGSF